MARLLQVIFFFCFLFATANAVDFCEDKSATIENGRIRCAQVNTFTTSGSTRRFTCTVSCTPGYHTHPARIISCNSRGTPVWKVDNHGNRAQVYYGTWNHNISQATCTQPTSCLNITSQDKPLYGDIDCKTEGETKICTRKCIYPYDVTQPEYRKENCSAATNFFWSHVLRNNATKMPPCTAPATCRRLRDSDTPEHGQMDCRDEQWADTIICELQCERGYVPKAGSKPFEFCGPTTAFIWSHVHAARSPYARIGGCEQSPITTEITVTLSKSCDSISSQDKQQGAMKLEELLNSTMRHNGIRVNATLINWRMHCHSGIIQDQLMDSSASAHQRELTGNQQELQGRQGGNLDNDMLPSESEGVQLQDNPESSNPVEVTRTANTTLNQLIFAFHYKVNCINGKCREACKVLQLLDEDSRCLTLCQQKARSAEDQVRHLTTSYAGLIFDALDVSSIPKIIPGGKFKSLNVTSKDPDVFNPIQNTVSYMMHPNPYINTYGDPC